MTDRASGRFHDGGMQGLAALAAAITTAWIVATSSGSDDELAARFAIVGAVLFAIALALGSARVIGATSIPVLGSALASSAAANGPAWVQSIVLGCLWYVAVELAWDSIERRDGAQRTSGLGLRRTNEVASIVVISLAVTVPAYAASSLDVPRTLVRQVVLVIALIAALGFTIRVVVATAPNRREEENVG